VTTIGLISDTHNLLREEARHALAGVDRIVHAGDICSPETLERLQRIAPLVAVRGNNDRGAWAGALAERVLLRVEDVVILVVHDLATLPAKPTPREAAVVVHGHSHRPAIETHDAVLYVNPGSAGPRRFKLPVSIAYLEIDRGKVRARLHPLQVAP
jgi:putative phosphoesterase